MPNKNKWQIHKVHGRWVVRLPNYIGHWIFTFTSHDTCIIFMNGVELFHRLNPEWHFVYHELQTNALKIKESISG